MMVPMATTVAGLLPERAAKNMQATTVARASPPLKRPTKTFITSMSRWAISPSVMMPPARIKKGIARRMKLSRALNSCWGRIVRGVMVWK